MLIFKLRPANAVTVREMADDSPPRRFILPREVAPDNRSLFIDAMAHPLRRRIAFNVVERNCRDRFAQGEDGIRLYLHLRGYVQSAAVDEAVAEFERRFEPMLDQELWKMARL
jgi:hypothetical protein